MKTETKFYKNGQVETTYAVDENGQKNGAYEEYYENGHLAVRCAFKNGKLEGAYESFYPDGHLEKKCAFKNGEMNGAYEDYNPLTKRLLEKGIYKSGKKDGLWEKYRLDGSLMSECNYKENKRDGSYKEYNENGELMEKGTYINGEFVPDVNKEQQGLGVKLAAAQAKTAPAKRSLVAEYRKMYPKNSGR